MEIKGSSPSPVSPFEASSAASRLSSAAVAPTATAFPFTSRLKLTISSSVKQLLSPRELANAIGVSQSSIKRWADDGLIRATRTAGGHRRIHITEAIRFLRENDAVLVQPQILGLPETTHVGRGPADLDSATEELTEYLRLGAGAESRGLLLSLYLSGFSIAQIADGPLREAMATIGHLWTEDRDEGVFVEHRATQICLQACHELRTLLPDHFEGPLAIGGAPPGDTYQLPSLMVATVLAEEGYRAVNLGPETPTATLLQAATTKEPRLLWLSISGGADYSGLTRDLAESLLPALAERGIAFAIGGRAFGNLDLRRLDHPRLFTGKTLAELVAFVRGLGQSEA